MYGLPATVAVDGGGRAQRGRGGQAGRRVVIDEATVAGRQRGHRRTVNLALVVGGDRQSRRALRSASSTGYTGRRSCRRSTWPRLFVLRRCRLPTDSLVATPLTSVTGRADGIAVDLELDGAGRNWVTTAERANVRGEGDGLAIGRGRAGVGRHDNRGDRRVGDGQGAGDGGELVVGGAQRARVDGDGVLADLDSRWSRSWRASAHRSTTLLVSPLTNPVIV